MSTISDSASDSSARAPAVGNGFAVDAWITLKRWLLKTIRNPFVLAMALVQPVIFLVLFTEVFGGVVEGALSTTLGSDVNYVTYLTPAIVIQSALIAAGGSGIGVVQDMEAGMFEKMLVSPLNRGAMFLGKALSEIVRIIVQSIIILGLGYLLLWFDTGGSVETYIQTGLLGALGIIIVAIVFSIGFTSCSNIFALVTRDQEATVIGMLLLQFPLLFISSAFVPIESLPEWMQVVATYNPVTYGVDAARALMLGRDVLTVIDVTTFSGVWNTLLPALAVLIALNLVLSGIAVYYLNRASSSKGR